MKVKGIFKKLVIILGFIIVLGVVGVSVFTGISVFKGTSQLVDNDSTGFEIAERYYKQLGFDLEEFKARYKIDTIHIQSASEDHIIPVDFISLDGDRNRDTIILVHGLGGNRWTNYPLASMFLENGYNVLSYDQRSSGDNTARYTSFGYLESLDLKDCVTYL